MSTFLNNLCSEAERLSVSGKEIFDDTYAKAINILGNDSELALQNSAFKADQTFTIAINKATNDLDKITRTFKIIKAEQDITTGFRAAIITDTTVGSPTFGKVFTWADGSKGFSVPNLTNLRNIPEYFNDWIRCDLFGIGAGKINSQLEELKKFMEDYGLDKINYGIGQSMAGSNMSALAYTSGFEKINFLTYSGPVPESVLNTIKNTSGWGLNSLNGSNLSSFYTPNEPLFNLLKPYFGDSAVYIKEGTNASGLAAHSATGYFSSGVFRRYIL